MKYVLMISVMLVGLLPTLTHANEDKPKQSAVLSTAIAKYEIRADGLACPYCAYGIEKKFKAIKGVKNIDVDLKKGIVKVEATPATQFTEQQLKTLFSDSGFTYRSIKKLPVAQKRLEH